ncbi:hypothetical protein PLIIFM63780_001312 [Purpureocillium lilacinum]|nr:hypothetical protein PLIIFM63780_001312 [Purpureocillium lilacinum]
MQASFNGRRDAVGPDGSRGAASPYGPHPASPTLTNPDMILPDYDDSESLDDDHHPLSPPSMWQHDAQGAANDFGSFSQVGYGSAPLGPTTPIIYGNGTMLSDIGEVTEVESTVGTQSRQGMSRLSAMGGDDTPLRSSPTGGRRLLKKRSVQHAARERRLSSDSTSTIDGNDRAAATFDDFDDAVSVDDSNFQGDDEESMASSYVDDAAALSPRLAARASAQGLNLNEDRFSTSSISKRAEQILANAKRRLTTMEGNLNRARTFSYSSVSDGSTPSPVGRPATSLREHAPHSSNHVRNVSETGFLQATARPTAQLQRSASALGAAGGYRQPVQSRSADPLGGRHSHSAKLSHHPLDTTLAPLSEDGDDAFADERTRASSQHNSIASPTFGVYPEIALTRSASVAQVRDLQDQMEGLKGKISSLKEQARADSMKRRSLQSLRTPSPFTHARWGQTYSERQGVSSPEQGSPALVTPWNGVVPGFETQENGKPVERAIEAVPEEDEQSTVGGFHEARETQENDEVHATEAEAEAEAVQEADTHYEGFDGAYHASGDDGEGHADEEEIEGGEDDADNNRDDVSESGESLYHDTVQHPISHEDREDAFDYEHFFLHSAMGTISRQGITRDYDYDSEGSDDSVQTTRGPTVGVGRRASQDTFVTVDSFATAAEGRESRNSTTTAGGRTEDGFVTPSEQFEDTTTTARRATLGGGSGSGSGSGSSGDEALRYRDERPRANSVLHRPASITFKAALHRPSVSSFESTGTNRSFPLVNRTRLSGGILTPGASPEYDLKQVAESLMSETTSVYDRESTNGGPHSPAIQMLSREDQLLVEHVVASLGKCVLGLTEASRTNPSGLEEFRRRIEAAKRVLESGE